MDKTRLRKFTRSSKFCGKKEFVWPSPSSICLSGFREAEFKAHKYKLAAIWIILTVGLMIPRISWDRIFS